MLSCPVSQSSHPLFLTPKSPIAIPIRDALCHDALRQFALDPVVTDIDYVESVVVSGSPVALHAIVVARGRRRDLVEIVDADPYPRSIDDEGLRLLAAKKLCATPLRLTRRDIQREPVASNARMVWDEHVRPVGMDRRLAIADVLDRCGPVTIRELSRELGRSAKLDVFALACATTLRIDIGGDLGRAIVTHGPAAAGRRLPVGFEQHYGRRA